jgi:hypothetical protein
MQVRHAWRGVREPGERLLGWALVVPGGRRLVLGSAFAAGVLAPVMLPVSVLAVAWAHGSGRRLALLTDRRVLLLRASRGVPTIDAVAPIARIGVRAGAERGDPVRLKVEVPGRRPAWFRPVGNGLEHRFTHALRTLAGADAPGAVC